MAVVLIQWRARGYERSRLIFPEEDQMVVKRDHAVCASHPIQAYMFQIFFIFAWAFGLSGLFCFTEPPFYFNLLFAPPLHIILFFVC
jgi:hypothetical protein